MNVGSTSHLHGEDHEVCSTVIKTLNPRLVAVSLRCKKKGSGYQVDKTLLAFLERRCWTLQKLGKWYAIMIPPDDIRAPFLFDVDVPTQSQIVTVATQKHRAKEPWAGEFGEWPAVYIPPRRWATTQVDPFRDQTLSKSKQSGTIPASFCVGFRLFWCAEVSFQNGNIAYFESESQPTQLQKRDFVPPDKIPPTDALVEGAVSSIYLNAYERNPEARRLCIEAHGTACCICGCSFEAVYGASARGYIHVHHLRPLAKIRGEHAVDPVKDLRPVCPNCHAVLHLGGRIRSIQEVRRMVRRQRHR